MVVLLNSFFLLVVVRSVLMELFMSFRNWVVSLDSLLLMSLLLLLMSEREVILQESSSSQTVLEVSGLGDIQSKGLLLLLFGIMVLLLSGWHLVDFISCLANTSHSLFVDSEVSEVILRDWLRDEISLRGSEDFLGSQVQVEKGQDGLLDVDRPLGFVSISRERGNLSVLVVEHDWLLKLSCVLLCPLLELLLVFLLQILPLLLVLLNGLDVLNLQLDFLGRSSLDDDISLHLEGRVLLCDLGDSSEKSGGVFIGVSLSRGEFIRLGGFLLSEGSGGQEPHEKQGKVHD